MEWDPATSGVDRPAAWTSLRQIMLARNITIGGLAVATVVVYQFLGVLVAAMTVVIAVLAVFNVATACRLQSSMPVTELEPLGQIVVDIVALSVFFSFSGGASNPFVDLFLVPLAIGAARLPRSQVLSVALLTLAAYLLLAFAHVALPSPREGAQGFHDFGMWAKFVLCAGFVGYLVLSIASTAREREDRLRRARQRSQQEEYLLRAGSLAAGAAHEIRSPLCTMAVVVNELLQRPQDRASRAKNLRMMSEQIEACRRIVSELMSYGQDALADSARREGVDHVLHDIVDRWRLLRPGATLACRRQGTQPVPKIAMDVGLGHAVLNLLNNAADASPQAVEMVCTWTPTELRIVVLDRGPGIASELFDVLGERFLTTKRDKGTGIGLLLAKTAIERAGGSLKLTNRPGGGACAEVVVPLVEQPSAEQSQPPADRATLTTAPLAVRYYQSSSGGA